jgi:hypothetical protein
MIVGLRPRYFKKSKSVCGLVNITFDNHETFSAPFVLMKIWLGFKHEIKLSSCKQIGKSLEKLRLKSCSDVPLTQ